MQRDVKENKLFVNTILIFSAPQAKMKEISDVSSKLEAEWKHASMSENSSTSSENENDQPFIEGHRTQKFSPLCRQVIAQTLFDFFFCGLLVGQTLWFVKSEITFWQS